MPSRKQRSAIMAVVCVLVVLLTACSPTSTDGGSNQGQTVPATTTSVPGVTFAGAFPGFLYKPGACSTGLSTDAKDVTYIKWEDYSLSDTPNANVTFLSDMEIQFGTIIKPPLTAQLVNSRGGEYFTPVPTTGNYAGISVSFGNNPRLYVPPESGSSTITVNADGKSGTLNAALVNSKDPTDTETLKGTWSCFIA